MSVIKRIVDLLQQKGISISEFAKLIGVNRATVSNWKQRNSNPPIELLAPIANVLNVSVLYLLGLQEDQGTPAPSSQSVSPSPTPAVPRKGLTAKEEELLSIFRDLSDDSQEIVMATAYLERRAHPDKEARRGLIG